MEWEKRAIATEQVRAETNEAGEMVLSLFALPFNSPSRDLGGFTEVISPELRINRWNDDLFALHNHNWDLELGREGNGTLRMLRGEDGIRVEIDLIDAEFERRLFKKVQRGDIPGASFSFATDSGGDSWERGSGGRTVRTLHKITLREFSTVPVAAYGDTEVGVALRSLLEYSQEYGREVSHREAEIRKRQLEAVRLPPI